ncbi:MAG: hypothetical protein ACE5G2_09465 [Candidatus Krumholzibacteriia bacterium]
MRASQWLVLSFMVLGGCRADVSQPDLRRPLETLPGGACVLLVSSDLANTWERAEAHEALEILRKALPGVGVFTAADFADFQRRLEDFEQRTGTGVRDDLLLNVLGGRIAVGMYRRGRAERGVDVLFVAELEDPERFRSALEAVRNDGFDPNFRFEDVVVDGRPGWSVEDRGGLDLVLVQEGRLLVVTTSEALLHETMDIHEGRSEASAMRDPDFVEALDELGLHNVAVVRLGDAVPWSAQGFTWDADGLHFKRVVSAPAAAEEHPMAMETPLRREAILRSIPAGVTMAYYARPTDVMLLRGLFRDTDSCDEGRSSAGGRSGVHLASGAGDRVTAHVAPTGGGEPWFVPAAPPLGMQQLPFNLHNDVLPWSGDEMALALEELIPTPLAPVPSLALIVEVADAEMAERTLRDLESTLTHLPLEATTAGFVDVRYGGKTFRSFAQPFLEAISPSYLIDADVAILTTTRQLMQRIIDTRRVGKRHLLRDSSFRPFGGFVPETASVVAFADQRRLHRALRQLAHLPQLWGDNVAQGVEFLDGISILFEHFPAGAVFIERTPTTLSLNGWMLEAD